MARRGRKPVVETMSIAALERILTRRRKDVEALETRRTALQKELTAVDAELVALVGADAVASVAAAAEAAPAPTVRHRRRRLPHVAGQALNDFMARVLKSAGKPLRAAEVTAGVLETGYKTLSKNLKQIVASALSRLPQAKRVDKGLYAYAGEATEGAPAPRRGRPRKVAQAAS